MGWKRKRNLRGSGRQPGHEPRPGGGPPLLGHARRGPGPGHEGAPIRHEPARASTHQGAHPGRGDRSHELDAGTADLGRRRRPGRIAQGDHARVRHGRSLLRESKPLPGRAPADQGRGAERDGSRLRGHPPRRPRSQVPALDRERAHHHARAGGAHERRLGGPLGRVQLRLGGGGFRVRGGDRGPESFRRSARLRGRHAGRLAGLRRESLQDPDAPAARRRRSGGAISRPSSSAIPRSRSGDALRRPSP